MATKQKTLKCKFGQAGNAKFGCAIGVSLSRDGVSPNQIDELLTGAQLEATLECDPEADADVAGQRRLTNTSIELTIIAECQGFSTRPDHYQMRLKIHSDETDLNELAKFSFHDGKLGLKRTGNSKAKDEDKGDGDG